MTSPDWIGGLAGGALIGAAVSLLLWLDGRIAGVSGILGGLPGAPGDRGWRLAFLAGLPLGAGAFALWAGGLPQQLPAGGAVLAAAGLLVGFGTRLGSGCTSGHGICGIARLSPRSLAATGVFTASGALTVFLTRHVLS